MSIGIGTQAANVANMAKMEQAVKRPVTNATYASSIATRANDAQEGAIHKMLQDTDGDGKVSAAEKSAHAADIAAHKDQIDRDGDGKLSFQEELTWALDQGDVTRSQVSAFLAKDTNKDGKVSLAETVAYVAKRMKATAMKG